MESTVEKKNLIYLIFFLFIFNPLIAKVNPQPGENLWRLTARIGDCVDIADSKLDFLASQNDLICSKVEEVDEDLATHNDVVCSKLDDINSMVDSTQNGVEAICSKVEDFDTNLSVHDALICSKIESVDTKQDLLLSAIDDLAFAGTCETLIFQSDIPFTITTPGVYCLAESVNFASGTAITIAADNVVIDLQDKKIDGSLGGDVGVAINSGLQNITIQNGSLCNMNDKGIDADATNNIEFISMSVNDSLIDMPVSIAPISCLQIKDIKVLNVGQLKAFPIISIIDSLIDSIIDTPDCVLSEVTGIHLNCVNEVILDNCKTLNCFGDGFAIQGVENATLKSCQAIKSGGNGFVLDNTDTSCFKWCKANMNCLHGFCDSACNGDNAYFGCIAKQNGIHGFNIAGGGKTMKECISSQNTRDGFHLSSSLLNDGDLDTTFGDDGKVTTDFGKNDIGLGVAIQKDGKIVVVGASTDDPLMPPVLPFALARYNTDGSLDPMFGVGGKVTVNFQLISFATAVALQKNGKIVASGLSIAGGGDINFVTARFNSDGGLDESFGTDGRAITDFGGNSDTALVIVVQKDGKIVVGGASNDGDISDFALARYNTDGSLDTTFGNGGKVVTDFGGSEGITSIALQKDGKIVAVGVFNENGSENFAVARYNTDGSLDLNFGFEGKVITSFTDSDTGRSVALQKNGKIIVVGSTSDNFALARYNADGRLDNMFGVDGKVITNLGGTNDEARGVVLQKDGKIVAAGISGLEFALVRYNTNGSLDTKFGTGGIVKTSFEGITNEANAIILQKNGKIVLAGQSGDANNMNNNFAIARYVVFKQGVAVHDCIAEENGEDGFSIAGKAYNVRSSTAIHNVADGFLLDSLTDSCQLLSNEALQNNNVGIENLGVDNQLLNNRSHDNTGGNYVGVPLVATPTLSIVDFWANVEI